MMQSGARVGLSVGVLVLVSTANWQGTQPHSTRFTTALSIESDIYLVVGGRELVKLSCLERGVAVRCRSCAQRGVVRARCLNAPGLWRAQNELLWQFAHCTPRAGHATCWLPAWSLYLLSYPLLSRAATAPVPRSQARLPLPVSGPPSWSTWQDINTTAAN